VVATERPQAMGGCGGQADGTGSILLIARSKGPWGALPAKQTSSKRHLLTWYRATESVPKVMKRGRPLTNCKIGFTEVTAIAGSRAPSLRETP
jgi:hypothetical protein